MQAKLEKCTALLALNDTESKSTHGINKDARLDDGWQLVGFRPADRRREGSSYTKMRRTN